MIEKVQFDELDGAVVFEVGREDSLGVREVLDMVHIEDGSLAAGVLLISQVVLHTGKAVLGYLPVLHLLIQDL